jgi:OOP family OmpA-OmpF porin
VTQAPAHLAVVSAICALAAVGCSGRKVRQPEVPGQALVVLLPDADTGQVGQAVVSNRAGSVELTAAREATVVTARQAPEPVQTLAPADVRGLFGDVLSALPPPERNFTLFFRFDSEQLTPESQALAAEIVRVVKDTRVPDVLIVGHTDTTGSRPVNFELGLRRANRVRTILLEAGLDARLIDVTSHGETEPLVDTADGVFEARNRRVEVTVK